MAPDVEQAGEPGGENEPPGVGEEEESEPVHPEVEDERGRPERIPPRDEHVETGGGVVHGMPAPERAGVEEAMVPVVGVVH